MPILLCIKKMSIKENCLSTPAHLIAPAVYLALVRQDLHHAFDRSCAIFLGNEGAVQLNHLSFRFVPRKGKNAWEALQFLSKPAAKKLHSIHSPYNTRLIEQSLSSCLPRWPSTESTKVNCNMNGTFFTVRRGYSRKTSSGPLTKKRLKLKQPHDICSDMYK